MLDVRTVAEAVSVPADASPDFEALSWPEARGWETKPPDVLGCAPGSAGFGCPCTGNQDCASAWCVLHLGEQVCTKNCVEECPPGWRCQAVPGPDPMAICYSVVPALCLPCETSQNCELTGGGKCISYGDAIGLYCGAPCDASKTCPSGYECTSVTTVEGQNLKQCARLEGECTCTSYAALHALQTPCTHSNEFGACPGWRECTDSGLSDCNAAAPELEICDGKDNNCDGVIDLPVDCDDGTPCMSHSCAGSGGCVHEPMDGGDCDDGSACTLDDHCKQGECSGLPLSCYDGNPCTDDECDEKTGCYYANNTLPCEDDANVCTANVCNGGTCGTLPANDGANCPDDGDACTADMCGNGECTHFPGNDGADCPDDGNLCTLDLCDGGVCSHPPDPKAPLCDDGDECTLDDHCVGNQCIGELKSDECKGGCGDGKCEFGESADDCPADCGWCGDGMCGVHENGPNGGSCPKDCLSACGDGKCEGGENFEFCLIDCGACGDGFCGLKESTDNCAGDCPPTCGNGKCEFGEHMALCPVDCMPPCGDGVCQKGENPFVCPVDCTVCGDAVCGKDENGAGCPQDCLTPCGNGVCEGGENPQDCAIDCGWCGDGVCGFAEKAQACPADCAESCGDGQCQANLGETDNNCPADCEDDQDNDGITTAEDNCPSISNPDQADFDQDDLGDVCDLDDDSDFDLDASDCAPLNAQVSHFVGEVCDGIDNDCNGLLDEIGCQETGSCFSNDGCETNKCVDGYCCDTWCAGQCQACNVPDAEGICSFHPPISDPEAECGICRVCDGSGSCVNMAGGVDPLQQCQAKSPSVCGHDGTCDGKGACRHWDSNTVCQPQTCAGHLQTGAKQCTGSGTCGLGGQPKECCPYLCAGDSCGTGCLESTQCCTGYVCQNGQCMPKKANGTTCVSAGQCQSGLCIDGYCCDDKCDGGCQACNVPGSLGACTDHSTNTDPENECEVCKVCNGSGSCVNVTNGSDPLGDCLQEAPCGQDGFCDGQGKCRLWIEATECTSQTCSGTTLYLSDYCDGDGMCVDSGTVACAPYRCSGNSCGTNCAGDGDCAVGFRCSASDCVPKKGLGESCGAGTHCLSGHCIDDVCCDTECAGLCQACNLAGSAGTCTFVGNNVDPSSDCAACQACDGAGHCKNVSSGQDPGSDCTQTVPNTCGSDGTCDGQGGCRKWSSKLECGMRSCVGTTLYPTDYCDGEGACLDSKAISCCPYKCGAGGSACRTSCDSDAECCPNAQCVGSTCVADTGVKPCIEGADCSDGKCVDGYCCDSWCAGPCENCAIEGNEGICSPYLAWTDPEFECGPLCHACDGDGACGPVKAGLDPENECEVADQATCSQDGACDGKGVCSLWSNSTVCEKQTCADTTLTLPDYCDGQGSCQDGGVASCCPYRCNSLWSACRTSCFSDTDCCDGTWCQGSTCAQKKADGETCSDQVECASGHCVDGLCCDKKCDSNCMGCHIGGFEGSCAYYSYLTDPDDNCGLCSVCNGSGDCMHVATGTDPWGDCAQESISSCGQNGVCDEANSCAFWSEGAVCSPQKCVDNLLYFTDTCIGEGECADGGLENCCPYKCLGEQCNATCKNDAGCCDDALCKADAQCKACSAAPACLSTNWCCGGDSCDQPIVLEQVEGKYAGLSFYGSVFGAADSFQYECCQDQYGSDGKDRVFKLSVGDEPMQVEIKTWGDFDTILYVRKGPCGDSGETVGFNDNGCGLADNGSCLNLVLPANSDYFIYVDSHDADYGDFELTVRPI